MHHGAFFGKNARPYTCLAFLFDKTILYMADVSDIPASTYDSYEAAMNRPEGAVNGTVVNNASPIDMRPPLPILIVDWFVSAAPRLASGQRLTNVRSLRIHMHHSHFGVQQAVTAAARLRAQRSYMVGFAHRVSFVQILEQGVQ